MNRPHLENLHIPTSDFDLLHLREAPETFQLPSLKRLSTRYDAGSLSEDANQERTQLVDAHLPNLMLFDFKGMPQLDHTQRARYWDFRSHLATKGSYSERCVFHNCDTEKRLFAEILNER